MFAQLFVRRPTLVFVLIAIFTLAGAYSMMTLVKQRFPTVDVPTISVTANYAGASTSEMRDAVVRPLEDAIAGAPNLDYITSSIQQGQATISVAFTVASDKNADIIEVQRRVQNAGSKLPADLHAPTVSSFDPSQSTVVTLMASSTSLAPGDLSALITNQIVPRLEEVPGISNANPQGAVTPALVTAVDPVRLAAAGATVTDVLNAISNANNRAPGGYATASGKETTIDIRADITSPGSIADLLLYGGSGSNAAPSGLAAWSVSPRLLHVSDVATVSSGFEPPRSYAFFGGRSAINLTLTKATGASEVSSANAVIAALPALRAQFPQITFTLGNVESVNTQEQLDGVEHTLLEGIALTAIVMLFFLKSWRNAVVVIVAIPTSLLVTLTVMKVYNFTLDTLSLCAMTLVIGILVDDSIVVLENIERHLQDGEDPKTASIKGPGEIGLAALVITLVIVAVFLPIAFLPGIVGKFLIGFALVVVVATLTSLLISFSVTPSLAGNWSLYSTWKAPAFIEAFDRGFERLTWWYTRRALPWALRNPKTIVAVCALSAVGAIALVPLGAVGFEFIPAVDRGELTVQLTLPPGTAISQTASSTRIVERYIDTQVGDLARETAIAGGSTAQIGGVVMQGNVAEISVTLRDDRKRSTTDWTTALLAALPPLVPGTGVTVIPTTGTGGGPSQPISYVLRGAGGADPATDAARVAAVLASVPGAQNVTNSAGAPAPQVEVQFDRAAARARNVDIGSAASAVRAAFGGTAVTQYNAPQGITDVEVIYPASDRSNLSAIASIAIRNNNGDVVHIGDFTHLRQVFAPPIITRQDRQTVVSIGSNVAPGYSQSGVQAAFEAKLRSFHFRPGVSLGTSAGGTGQNLIDTVTGMAFALTIAIVMVYLLMVALFDSYIAPAIILSTVPVAIVGALGALALTHKTLNLFSLIGMILLIALVAKNGILLVDFANNNRKKGMSKIAAILNSAHVRFRPIMMTTIAMIAGMFPLALAIEAGAEERQSLGIVIIGGLTSSLVLTLLLIPVIYLWLAPKERREDPSELKLGEPNPGLAGHAEVLRPAAGSAS
jgi:HAE1 family hydrophobic/amphiphilic exporter-1